MLLINNSQNWLKQASESFPHSTAIIFENNLISFGDLFQKVNALSTYLHDEGIKENDHVGLLFTHSKDFLITVNALWLLNAIPVLLNSRNTAEEISVQIKHANVKFLIFDQSMNSQYSPLGLVCSVLVINKIPTSSQKHFDSSSFSSSKNAVIIFTSGSSNKPKAVVHTFNSLFASVNTTDSEFEFSSSDKWLASLPLYHIGGFMILVRALLSGSTIIFPKSLFHQHIEESISSYHPTHISLVSASLKRMIDNKFNPNNNMKYVFLGGGFSSQELCMQALETGWPIVKVYGSTETCSMVTAAKISLNKINSSGKILGNNIVKIDENEILVRSESLFKEYYNDAELTNQKIKGGYYHTGDIGWIDNDNYLYVEARRNDIIISGGENISIREVELALISIPEIKDAFVFAIKDNEWGQLVCTAIEANIKDETTIKLLLKERIASYKIPKLFFFLDSLPRNEMGKINRSEILDSLNLNEL